MSLCGLFGCTVVLVLVDDDDDDDDSQKPCHRSHSSTPTFLSLSLSLYIHLSIYPRVVSGGCNGLSYTLNYAYEEPKNFEKVEAHGVKVYIEPMALLNVIGTTMDWEETEMTSEFTFTNPNSKGECGCGESFTV